MAGPIIADITNESTQSSPDCFVRFVRFVRRDTREYDTNDKKPKTKMNRATTKESAGGIRHELGSTLNKEETESSILDVASDVMSCIVSKSKSSPSGTFTIVLSPGDVNYHHAIHPGDHVFIWMKRDRQSNIKNGFLVDKSQASDSVKSGLKMWGVVTGVRRIFKVAPNGAKQFYYQITGKDFGYFFETDVYYNPEISQVLLDTGFFNATQFGISGFPIFTPDQLVRTFIDTYLGSGPRQKRSGAYPTPATENDLFFLPDGVKSIFGKGQTLADIIGKRTSIESYSSRSVVPDVNSPKMEGIKVFHIGAGAQYKLWSILQAYANLTINEMFLDLKPNEDGVLRPTFTLRQIPFTSKKAQKRFRADGIASTAFVDLPKLRIAEEFIIEEDIGRGDHERFNFIQLFGTFPGLEELVPITSQIASGNYAMDSASIKRYGLKTLIPKTDYHIPDREEIGKALKNVGNRKEIQNSLVPKWINLLSDWWLGAHVFESGTFKLIGIQEHMSVGDNIEIVRKNGVSELYHVEGYQHVYAIEPAKGNKVFRTTVSVSRGQRSDEYPIYASGQLNEEDVLDIGLSDTEFEGTARPGNSLNEDSGISPNERPNSRKKGKLF